MSLADAWVAQVSDVVRAEWAGALPDGSLYRWWTEGDRERVYALCRWSRARQLAWYAGLDPEPQSPAAIRAARLALRSSWDLASTLAVLPLDAPVVARAAQDAVRGDREAGQVLRVRQGRHLDADLTPSAAPDLARVFVPEAVAIALRLDQQGLRADARAMLARAWASASNDTEIQRLLLVPTRWLRAWDLVPSDALPMNEGVLGFVAGLDGEAAAAQVVGRGDVCVAGIALGVRPLPAAWRPVLDALSSAEIETRYSEGLYSSDDAWCLHLAKALQQPRAARAADAALITAMTEAQASVDGLRARIAARRAGPPSPEDLARARRSVKRALTVEGRTVGHRLRRPLPVLAEAGLADEVRAAIAAVEAKHPDDHALPALRLLVPGQSHLALADPDHFPTGDFAAALMRDGHRDDAARVAAHVLARGVDADDLAVLAKVIDACEPNEAARLTEELDAAIAALPGVSEDAARSWMLGDPED